MTQSSIDTGTSHSPLGESVDDAIAEATLTDPAYRRERERLAPFHAIAATVIAGRNALGLTQEALADRIESSSTAISRLESGRHPTTVRTLQRLSDALGVTFSIQPQRGLSALVEEDIPEGGQEWGSQVLTDIVVSSPPSVTALIARIAEAVVYELNGDPTLTARIAGEPVRVASSRSAFAPDLARAVVTRPSSHVRSSAREARGSGAG